MNLVSTPESLQDISWKVKTRKGDVLTEVEFSDAAINEGMQASPVSASKTVVLGLPDAVTL